MSTSDKLTYLNTTKSKIKQAINLAGASLTNEPFRQYSSKLYDSYLDILKNGTGSLYSAMPKVTGTGTELSLQNTAECPMVLELGASESTQNTSKLTYVCDGTETGDYYLTYDNTNYEFTMPTIASNDILVFDTSNLKLYLSTTEISTTVVASPISTQLTFIASPNPNYPQSINVVTGNNSVKVSTGDKNLANLPVSSSYLNGLTPTITNGSIIHVEGTASASYSNITSSQTVDTTEVLTLSITDFPTTGGLQVVYKETSDGEYKNKTLSTNDSTITFENGLYNYRIAFVYLTTNTAYNLTFKVQLEKGSTATSYAVHQEQNFTLSLGSLELAGIGDYKDKIFNNVPSNPLYDSNLVEGGWYKYKVIGKEKLSSSNVVYHGVSNGIYQYELTPVNALKRNAPVKSTHFGNKTTGSWWTNDNNIITYFTGGANHVFITTSKYNSISALNNFTSENDSYVYGPLETPTTEQITDTTLVSQLEAIKNAVSYDDETNISQTNANRPFIISASAIKNSME